MTAHSSDDDDQYRMKEEREALKKQTATKSSKRVAFSWHYR